MPLLLAYATKRTPEPPTDCLAYDPAQQMSVCPDGTLAARNIPVLLSTASTVSSAGSKRHADDA